MRRTELETISGLAENLLKELQNVLGSMSRSCRTLGTSIVDIVALSAKVVGALLAVRVAGGGRVARGGLREGHAVVRYR